MSTVELSSPIRQIQTSGVPIDFTLVDPRAVSMVCLFFASVAFWIAIAVFAIRVFFGTPGSVPIALALLTALTTIFGVQQVILLAQKRNWSVEASALAAVFVLLLLPSMSGPSIAVRWCLAMGMMIVVFLGLQTTLPYLRSYNIFARLFFIFVPVLVAATYFMLKNSFGWGSVFVPELTLAGKAPVDTLYHSAIAGMMSEHNIPSTGLDGLKPLKYHIASHYWIGRFAQFLGVSPLFAYVLAPQIVFIPLLFLATCFVCLRSTGIANKTDGPHKPSSFNALIIVLAPLSVLAIAEIWDRGSYGSESHMLAMIFFLFGLPLLISSSVTTCRRDLMLRLIVLTLFGGLLAALKVSVGFIWFVGVGFVTLRNIRILGLARLVVIGLIAAVIAAIIKLAIVVDRPEEFSSFYPLHYLQAYPESAIVNAALLLSLVVLSAMTWNRFSLIDRRAIELYCLLSFVAFAITLSVKMGGRSEYYFINVCTFVAVAALSRHFVIPFMSRIHSSALAGLVLLAVLLGAWIISPDKRLIGGRLVSSVVALSEAIGQPVENVWDLASPVAAVKKFRVIAAGIRDLPGAQIEASLLRNLEFGAKGVALYVPPSNLSYWNLYNDCSRKALTGPVLIGIPMINGLAPASAGCDKDQPYQSNYHASYNASSRSDNIEQANLCTKAIRLNFSRVFVLETTNTGHFIECRKNQ